MSQPQEKCTECDGPLEAGNICPNCLLKMASLSTDQINAEINADLSDPVNSNGPPHPLPDIDAVRAAFPQLEIIELIGQGGMGTVFKARQPKLDRFVAVKILAPHLADTATFAERFAQEGKLLARLSHPNIVSVYDYGQAEGFYYLILEHIDGVNLRQAMRERRFSPEQALSIVPKICDALQYAHDEGVLHRDIKPENILLDTRGRIKITDFGIGKFTNKETATDNVIDRSNFENSETVNYLTDANQILGTPNYMAPEQRDAPNTVDHRADIYSLGVVFYELLTGELPKGQFALPSEKTPVDAQVDEIVLKALEREREKRFQSAEELKTEIESVTEISPSQNIDEKKKIDLRIKKMWNHAVEEIKTWPIWATILVGTALLSVGLSLAVMVIYLAIVLLVFLYGDLCETIFFGHPFISHWEVGITVGFLILLFLAHRFRQKRKSPEEPTKHDENFYVRKLWVQVSASIVAGVCFLYMNIKAWEINGESPITWISTIAMILFFIFSVINILDLHRKSVSSKSNLRPPQAEESLPSNIVSKPASEETLWDAFCKVPLWMYLFAFFALMFVLPSIVSIAALIMDYFSGDLNRGWEDIYVTFIPLLIFITAMWIMRHWRVKPAVSSKKQLESGDATLKTVQNQRRDTIPIIVIIILGYAVPFVSPLIGAHFYQFKPWFFRVDFTGFLFWGMLNMIAVATAIFLFRASRGWGELSRYFSIIGGYGVLAYCYSWFGIVSDPQAPIALIFFPIYAIPGFIGGFFAGSFFNYLESKA